MGKTTKSKPYPQIQERKAKESWKKNLGEVKKQTPKQESQENPKKIQPFLPHVTWVSWI